MLFQFPPLNFLRKRRNVKRFTNFKKTINFKKLSRSYLAPTYKSKIFEDTLSNKSLNQNLNTHFRRHQSSHFQRLRIRLTQKILFSKKRQLSSYLKWNRKYWTTKRYLFPSFLNTQTPRYTLKLSPKLSQKSRKNIPYNVRRLRLIHKILRKKRHYVKFQKSSSRKRHSKVWVQPTALYRRIKRLNRTKIWRKTLLKSNTKINYSNEDFAASFLWSKSPRLRSYQIVNHYTNSLLCDRVRWKNYSLQFFGATTSPKSILMWLILSPSFCSWFSMDFSLLINPHRINQSIMANSSISFISNFFNFNRLTNYQNQNLNNQTTLALRENFTNNLSKIAPHNFINTRKTRRFLVRVLFMLFRYVPCLTLMNVFRQHKIERKTFSYLISQKEFELGRLIRVNESYKELSLSMMCRQDVNSLLHGKGLPTLMKLLSNDNCFEVSYDENLQRTNLLKFSKSLYTKLNLHKNNIFRYISRSVSNYYKDKSLSLYRTSDIVRLSLRDRIQTNIMLPLSQTVLNDARLVNQLYNNSLLFKYFLFNTSNRNDNVYSFFSKTAVLPLLKDLTRFNFSSRITFYQNSNLWPSSIFKYAVRRKILKEFTYNKFLPNVTMWYYNTLIRFMENCSGKKVYLKFNPFIENSLTFSDLARCQMWMPRLWSFQKLLGHRIFINESLKILHLALRFKDPVFLSNWIKSMLYRLSFWKYRLLFRYLKYAMRYLFWTHFPELNFKGLKLKLKGKISVAGSARTRTLVYKIGETSHATVNNRVLSHFTTVNTFTGVMGFRMWFYF